MSARKVVRGAGVTMAAGVKRTLGSRVPGETKRLRNEFRYLKKLRKGAGEDLRDRDRRRTAWQKKQHKHGRARKDSKKEQCKQSSRAHITRATTNSKVLQTLDSLSHVHISQQLTW